jgi:hypothetical protein
MIKGGELTRYGPWGTGEHQLKVGENDALQLQTLPQNPEIIMVNPQRKCYGQALGHILIWCNIWEKVTSR